MKTSLSQLAIAGIVVLAVSPPTAAHSDEDGDHDRARDLFERGEIRALHDVLRIVGERAPGEIVTVDLIRLGDKWIYRFQNVDFGGRRSIVEVEAGTVKVMRREAD